MRRRFRHGRERGQLRIRLVVARQQRQRDPILARQRRQALDPVGPISPPTEQPHYDEPRLRQHLLDIEIDRVVVAELEQAGEAQAGRVAFALREATLRRGEAGDLAVGRREHDDVCGRLAEIDCGAAIGDGAGLGG